SGPRLAYEIETVLCVTAAVLFTQIAYMRAPLLPSEATIGQNLTVGIRFLMKQPELLGAQVLDLFSVLFGGAPALLPIFSSEILHVGPQGLGILRSAPAAGAVLISLLLIHRRLRNSGPTLFVCLVTLGVVGVTAWKIPRLRQLDELG